jgi:hypothetical protein
VVPGLPLPPRPRRSSLRHLRVRDCNASRMPSIRRQPKSSRDPIGKLQLLCERTCSLPFSSRSPRNFTITTSSMHRRTRSSGSLVSSFSSMVEAIVWLFEIWLTGCHCFGAVNFGSYDRLGGSGELADKRYGVDASGGQGCAMASITSTHPRPGLLRMNNFTDCSSLT